VQPAQDIYQSTGVLFPAMPAPEIGGGRIARKRQMAAPAV
jgi:hypothetical protein